MLTKGALQKIYDGAKSQTFQPIVQILKLVKNSRYFGAYISDGDHYTQSLCSLDANNLMDEVQENLIVSLSNYNVVIRNNIKLITISKLDIIQLDWEKIGEPVALEVKVNPQTIKSLEVPDPSPPLIAKTNPEDRLERTSSEAQDQILIQTPFRNTSYFQSESRVPDNQDDSSVNFPLATNSVDDENSYTPICALSATSSDWTVKARVIEKSSVRHWDKPNNKGKLFDILIIDSRGDQVKGTFWNNSVDQFFDVIEIMKVYTFSGGNIRSYSRAYSNLSISLEIAFDKNSIIIPVLDNETIPSLTFKFVTIDRLPTFPVNSIVDIAGFTNNLGSAERIVSKKNEVLIKRTIELYDHTDHSIDITLWNDLAESTLFTDLDLKTNPIICFKNLKIRDFNKISLSSDRGMTKIFINPIGNKDANFLKEWKQKKQQIVYPSTPLTEKRDRNINAKFKTTAEIKEEWSSVLLHNNNKTDNFRIIGILGKIQNNDDRPIWYQSCLKENCKKKVSNDHNRNFYCDSCSETFETCKYRYLCNLIISDCTGYIYATAFDEAMNALLGITADDLHNLSLVNQQGAEEILARFSFRPVNALLNAKENEGRSPYRFTVKRFEDYNAESISKLLLQELRMS